MISFFYYQQHQEDERWTTSDAQDAKIAANDLEGWFQVLQEEHLSSGTVAIPFQYHAIDKTMHKAVELITSGRIMVLSSLCVETSIRLLAHAKPHFFPAKSHVISSFLNSTDAHSRPAKNTQKHAEQPDGALARVKALHRRLLHKDWTVYKAALLQFQGLLQRQAHKMDPSEVFECQARIDRELRDMDAPIVESS